MNYLEQIFTWFKPSAKHALPVALVTTALLLVPQAFTDRLGLSLFVNSYRMWIGLAWLFSVALLASLSLLAIKDPLLKWLRMRSKLKAAKAYLRRLTPSEKRTLAQYVCFNTKTQNLDCQCGVVNGLADAHVIYQSASIGSLYDGFAYNIEEWAWSELNAHTDLLEPELSAFRTDQQERGRRR